MRRSPEKCSSEGPGELCRQTESLASLFVTAFRTELKNAPQLLLQVGWIALFLSVFHLVWLASAASGLELPGTPAQLSWYLAITEMIVLSCPWVHREVEEDLLHGRIMASLLRPLSYIKIVYFQSLGVCFARLGVMASAGIITATILTGQFPDALLLVTLLIFFVPFSCAGLTLFLLAIGLGAVWMGEAKPLYWVYQKSLFILGGLQIPIVMYPEWFQSIAALLPFKPFLNGIAQGMLGATYLQLTVNLALMVVWCIMGLCVVQGLYARFIEKMLRGEV